MYTPSPRVFALFNYHISPIVILNNQSINFNSCKFFHQMAAGVALASGPSHRCKSVIFFAHQIPKWMTSGKQEAQLATSISSRHPMRFPGITQKIDQKERASINKMFSNIFPLSLAWVSYKLRTNTRLKMVSMLGIVTYLPTYVST